MTAKIDTVNVGANALAMQHGAPSYWLKSDKVELYLTEEGGQMAPVRFKLKHRWVSPYALAPWQPDAVDPALPPVLKLLRGDCFCLPFGPSKAVPWLHGEPANLPWSLQRRNVRTLELQRRLDQPQGQITKCIQLKTGQRAVYQEHLLEGLQGKFNYGHQTILAFPPAEKGFINTSALRFAQVAPEGFTDPVKGEYSSLKACAVFEDLAHVPLATGGTTSLQQFPAREGFEDLVMVINQPDTYAWTAATLGGYIWFSLKQAKTLPSTLLWFSHGGRHNAPWHGRHRFRVGLQEVNAYFADGLEASRKNPLSAQGFATAHRFNRRNETRIRLIQAVHPVSKSFGMVVSIEPVAGAEEVLVTGEKGQRVTVPLSWQFLAGEDH